MDELDINPFFRQLQTSYSDVYERAQEKCYLICIPQASSLRNYTISQKFVETHILRPSPYFKGQFLPLISSEKVVHLEENHLKGVEGFPDASKVKIVSEELGYNKNYKPYKILVIERPLDTSFQSTQTSQYRDWSGSFSSQEESTSFTYEQCRKILLMEFGLVMKSVDESLEKFNSNYMILVGYLDDARHRLEAISTQAVQKCQKCNKQKKHVSRSLEELESLMECYVVGQAHQKLFRVICEKFSSEDQLLLRKCKQLEFVSAEKLGVSSEFCCQLPEPVVELAHIDSLVTPLEKLQCLKTAIDSIMETVRSHVIDSHTPGLPAMTPTDIPCLTSDDLIPILVTVIAQAKCSHLASNMYYVETFHWSSEINERDNLSYCLVTFKAAVQYMINTDFQHLQSQSSKVKREISIDELMKATADTSLYEKEEDSQGQKTHSHGKPTISKGDRQLQNISKLLEKSFEDEAKSKKFQPKSVFGDHYVFSPPSDTLSLQDQRKKKQQLGEFLGALEDDIFDQSYGKQT